METGMLWAVGITLFGLVGLFGLLAVRYLLGHRSTRRPARDAHWGPSYHDLPDEPGSAAAFGEVAFAEPAEPNTAEHVEQSYGYVPAFPEPTAVAYWPPQDGPAKSHAELQAADGGLSVPLEPGQLLSIGRSRDCDLRLEQPTVSRRHALLTVAADGTVALEDLGSSNGTTVNERMIGGPVRLEEGDLVRFGRTSGPVFRYLHVAVAGVTR